MAPALTASSKLPPCATTSAAVIYGNKYALPVPTATTLAIVPIGSAMAASTALLTTLVTFSTTLVTASTTPPIIFSLVVYLAI